MQDQCCHFIFQMFQDLNPINHIYYTHKLVKTVTGIQVCDFVKYKILHFENISWDFKYFLNIFFF